MDIIEVGSLDRVNDSPANFKKVIFIVNLPLTLSSEKAFYVSQISNSDVLIEYWDVSALFFEVSLVDAVERPYIKKIDTYLTLGLKVKDNDRFSTLYVVQITYEYRSLCLFKFLDRFGCRLAQFDRPGFPMESQNQVRTSILNKILNVRKYPHYWNTVKKKMIMKFANPTPFSIIFAAGMQSVERNRRVSHVLGINHFDYDSYLETDATEARLVDRKYCVFLDEYLPYHSDFTLFGMQTVDAEPYYSLMNEFFERIEVQYGLQVVIACHPKADYSNNPYNGRLLFKYKTKELVKFSSLVVVHASTSNSFALIYKKPILFVYTEQFKKIFEKTLYALMSDLSNRLDARLMDVLEPLEEWDNVERQVKVEKYDAFLLQYLTTDSSMKTHTSKILIDFFKRKTFF